MASSSSVIDASTANIASSPAPRLRLATTSCGACKSSFGSVDALKEHSRSSWHVANVKRRVLGLQPVSSDEHRADRTDLTTSGQRPNDTNFTAAVDDESYESDSSESWAEVEPDDELEFVPEQCLFCNLVSSRFESNLAHMQSSHGMFIPDGKHLMVDEETLVRYLHLVIFGYNECLYCGKQHRTFEAVQQHMLGKGHCKFDISRKGSEFADFYERPDSQEDGYVVVENQTEGDVVGADPEASSLRLASGKVVSNRSAPVSHNHRPLPQPVPRHGTARILSQDKDAPDTEPTPQQRESGQVTKAERREQSFTTQLANLSLGDQRSMSHLPTHEQRALLATRTKQLDRAKRAERRYRSRVEALGNKTLMRHFVNDVPGRSNG